MVKISQLFCYPFKSARGIALDHTNVEERGLEFDRRWMAVDAGGRFLSQRTHSMLARITVRLDLPSGQLVLSHAGMNDLALPLSFTSPFRRNVVVWDDTMSALECGNEADHWITHVVGETASIVYFPDDSRRAVDVRYAHNQEHTAFADAYPVLVLSQASLDDLNSRLDTPLGVERFRPNVVVTGCRAYEEDTWSVCEVGSAVLEMVKPCARCVVTTIDQDTLARSAEPLATLSRYRQSPQNKTLFGQNALVRRTGTIRVGDEWCTSVAHAD
jgi:uncharacterized protein YcbX